MPEYRAPIDDIRFVLNELAGLPQLAASIPAFQSATPDVVDSILIEAAKLAGEIISPLNRSGDLKGVELIDGRVRVPEGFAEAYRAIATRRVGGFAWRSGARRTRSAARCVGTDERNVGSGEYVRSRPARNFRPARSRRSRRTRRRSCASCTCRAS